MSSNKEPEKGKREGERDKRLPDRETREGENPRPAEPPPAEPGVVPNPGRGGNKPAPGGNG